jgi:PEP-CTERM motif
MIARRMVLLSLAALLLASPAAAAYVDVMFPELRTYTTDLGTINYRMYVPPDLDPNESYPMFMWLHSSGHTDLTGSATYPDATYMRREWCSNPDRPPAFMIVPQELWPIDNLANLVLDLQQQEFPMLDAQRTYLTGWSLGGLASVDGTTQRPDVFAASAPMAGAADSPEAMADGSPVWAFMGGMDSNSITSVAANQPLFDQAIALGAPVFYTIYPEAGHNVGDLGTYHPGLYPWFMAQRAGEPHDTSMLIDPYGQGVGTVDIAPGEGKYLVQTKADGTINVAPGGEFGALRCSIEGQGQVNVDNGRFEVVEELQVGYTQLGTLSVAGADADVTVGGRYYQRDNGALVTTLRADGVATILVGGPASVDGDWTVIDEGAPIGVFDVLTTSDTESGFSGTFDNIILPGPNWGWGVRDDSTLWVEKYTALTLLGDANGDGIVSDADYTIWADHYGQTGVARSMGDFNGSGSVTEADYTIWADNYGAAIGSVPEPAALALLSLGAAALLRWRRD